ncbi:hypothetical protein N7454_003721 [Penicillium verhagenii]|nr:hypothetical protein N7454_003721 [Penicillium verhagenii]
MVVTAVLTGMAAFVVALRCYARFGLMKITGREDWAILGALLLSFAYCGLVGGEHHYGMGIHQKYLPAHIVQQQLKCLWAAIPLYNASLGFTKFSILFQYLRIFPARWFRNSCYVIMAIVATYSTWAVVSGYVNCVPVAKFWNNDLPGHCLSFDAVWFFNASMNIATDVTLLSSSQCRYSPRSNSRACRSSRSWASSPLVSFVITSILRLSSLRTVASSSDTSYSNVGAAYWTAAECNVAIICACLPFLRPILSVLLQSQLFSRNDERDYDVYSINVKPGDGSERTSLGGIEVTTEMTIMQETKHDENVSERRLVMDS